MFRNSPTHINISFSRGWLVTFAAGFMGFFIGVLYVWSVIKGGIPDSWGWSHSDKALPYSIMCVVFAAAMMPAGRFQDRYGPRWAIVIGGFLTGLGCVISGLGGKSTLAYVIGYGIITGSGSGLNYAALTPAAVKWFPPHRSGAIVGIVVGGFGLAPLLHAPLFTWLLNVFARRTPEGTVEMGVSAAMIWLGVLIWAAVGLLFPLVTNPPIGFVLPADKSTPVKIRGREMAWKQMLAQVQFWLLYVMFFAGASAGLVFIGVATDLGKRALGEWAFVALVGLAVGSTSGRVLAGFISDRIGRQWTLFGEFVIQAFMIATLYWLSHHESAWPVVLLVLFMIGFNYGANLTLFPSACKDLFGIRNFGHNYGWLITAFGLAGLIMPWISGRIRDLTGSLDYSYALIIGMMGVAAILALASQYLNSRHPGL